MYSISGRATDKGIIFSSNYAEVKATANQEGEYEKTIVRRRRKIGKVIGRIPFVRGLIIGPWQMTIVLLVFGVVCDLRPVTHGWGADVLNVLFVIVTVIVGILALLQVFGPILLNKKDPEMNQYHATEHKLINAYEHGLDLTYENFCRMKMSHPRCGTMYVYVLLCVIVPALIFVPLATLAVLIAVSLSIEAIEILSRPTMKFILKPLLWLQVRYCMSEPDKKHFDVAIRAFKRVLELSNQQSGVSLQ